MKIKGGFRYHAKLNFTEANIIRTALELLLDMYDNEEHDVNFNYYKDKQERSEVKALYNEMECAI